MLAMNVGRQAVAIAGIALLLASYVTTDSRPYYVRDEPFPTRLFPNADLKPRLRSFVSDCNWYCKQDTACHEDCEKFSPINFMVKFDNSYFSPASLRAMDRLCPGMRRFAWACKKVVEFKKYDLANSLSLSRTMTAEPSYFVLFLKKISETFSSKPEDVGPPPKVSLDGSVTVEHISVVRAREEQVREDEEALMETMERINTRWKWQQYWQYRRYKPKIMNQWGFSKRSAPQKTSKSDENMFMRSNRDLTPRQEQEVEIPEPIVRPTQRELERRERVRQQRFMDILLDRRRREAKQGSGWMWSPSFGRLAPTKRYEPQSPRTKTFEEQQAARHRALSNFLSRPTREKQGADEEPAEPVFLIKEQRKWAEDFANWSFDFMVNSSKYWYNNRVPHYVRSRSRTRRDSEAGDEVGEPTAEAQSVSFQDCLLYNICSPFQENAFPQVSQDSSTNTTSAGRNKRSEGEFELKLNNLVVDSILDEMGAERAQTTTTTTTTPKPKVINEFSSFRDIFLDKVISHDPNNTEAVALLNSTDMGMLDIYEMMADLALAYVESFNFTAEQRAILDERSSTRLIDLPVHQNLTKEQTVTAINELVKMQKAKGPGFHIEDLEIYELIVDLTEMYVRKFNLSDEVKALLDEDDEPVLPEMTEEEMDKANATLIEGFRLAHEIMEESKQHVKHHVPKEVFDFTDLKIDLVALEVSLAEDLAEDLGKQLNMTMDLNRDEAFSTPKYDNGVEAYLYEQDEFTPAVSRDAEALREFMYKAKRGKRSAEPTPEHLTLEEYTARGEYFGGLFGRRGSLTDQVRDCHAQLLATNGSEFFTSQEWENFYYFGSCSDDQQDCLCVIKSWALPDPAQFPANVTAAELVGGRRKRSALEPPTPEQTANMRMKEVNDCIKTLVHFKGENYFSSDEWVNMDKHANCPRRTGGAVSLCICLLMQWLEPEPWFNHYEYYEEEVELHKREVGDESPEQTYEKEVREVHSCIRYIIFAKGDDWFRSEEWVNFDRETSCTNDTSNMVHICMCQLKQWMDPEPQFEQNNLHEESIMLRKREAGDEVIEVTTDVTGAGELLSQEGFDRRAQTINGTEESFPEGRNLAQETATQNPVPNTTRYVALNKVRMAKTMS